VTKNIYFASFASHASHFGFNKIGKLHYISKLKNTSHVSPADTALFYGFRSKVSDVKNAVVLSGFNAVRNAIVSVSAARCPAQYTFVPGF
jgi:hypothetical protein